jgi:hypothetical protein
MRFRPVDALLGVVIARVDLPDMRSERTDVAVEVGGIGGGGGRAARRSCAQPRTLRMARWRLPLRTGSNVIKFLT